MNQTGHINIYLISTIAVILLNKFPISENPLLVQKCKRYVLILYKHCPTQIGKYINLWLVSLP
jgi:hypothetical protein